MHRCVLCGPGPRGVSIDTHLFEFVAEIAELDKIQYTY